MLTAFSKGPATRRLAAILLGLATSVLIVEVLQRRFTFDFATAALGELTAALYGTSASGGQVHCDGGSSAPCDEAYRKAGSPPAIYWIGNSQLHGVNRMQLGQSSAPMLLHERMRASGQYVVTTSLPNITFQEIVTLTNSVATNYNTKMVILPLVFNGLRGTSIRERELALLKDPQVAARISSGKVGPQMAPMMKLATAEQAQVDKTFVERVEDSAHGGLGKIWPLWSKRDELRALFRYFLHTGWHTAFGLTAQTKRPLLGLGYRSQMELAGNFIDDLVGRGIKVVVYIPPYRLDVPGPYIAHEYATFKAEAAAMAKARGAQFANLEAIVPGPDWGMVRDRLFGTVDFDFMHFSADGHAKLADALFAVLSEERK